MHRNIVRFAEVDREIELVADGTLWPKEVIISGEGWLMGGVVEVGDDYVVREYVRGEGLTPSQRLLRAIKGGG